MSEVLAPLGSAECLAAALNAGADAVYCGMKSFSARKNAENFSCEELKAAAEECHKRGVGLYVTLNTLVYDSEINEFAKCVKTAAECGADGIIVQDLGAAAVIRKICPEMPLHASTQMSLNSVCGVKAAEEAGYSRVVIGRELSAAEIREIKENTFVPLEIFVHGALCVCVSGQCFMSSVLGGRSGNRGLCAQPCRLDFSIGERHNVLSLKDISLAEHLSEFTDIASFKIEGRMKRPEYVACAVDACKKSLLGLDYDKQRLSEIFSRGGLTDGYFSGKMNDMQGVRGKDDVLNSAKAQNGIKALYKAEYPRIEVDIYVDIDEKITAKAFCEFGEASAFSSFVPEAAKAEETSEKAVCERMSKLGGTVFLPRNITAKVKSGVYVSAAALNALRRELCEKLSRLVLEKNTPNYDIKDFEYSPKMPNKKDKEPSLRCEVCSENQLKQALELPFELVFAPMGILSEDTPKKEKTALVLPFVLAGIENEVEKELLRLKDCGFGAGLAQNLAQAYLLRKCGFKIHGGFRMNVLNSLSASELEGFGFSDITLSIEGSAEALGNIICGVPKGIIAYGRLPLMLCRRCPAADKAPCKRVSPFGKGESCGAALTDRFKNKLPLLCGGNSVEVLNPDVLILSDKKAMLSRFDFITLKFTTETDIFPVFDMYKNGKKPFGKYTRGLYAKGCE